MLHGAVTAEHLYLLVSTTKWVETRKVGNNWRHETHISDVGLSISLAECYKRAKELWHVLPLNKNLNLSNSLKSPQGEQQIVKQQIKYFNL